MRSRRRHTIVRYTKFVKPEGAHDTTFLKLLREYYGQPDQIYVDIKKGKGGSQPDLVDEAIKREGSFDKRVVVMDGDRDLDEMQKADQKAEDNHIEIIRNFPCIEAVLIKILEPNKKISGLSSPRLKFRKDLHPRRKTYTDKRIPG